MIVVSLLLILVAVTLLVLGLAGGSSPLLISSIVSSLLAAVALVIGARQAAARRRRTVYTDAPAMRPSAAASPARRGARRRDAAAYAAGSGDAPSDFSGSDPISPDGGRVPDAEPESRLDGGFAPADEADPSAGPESRLDDGRAPASAPNAVSRPGGDPSPDDESGLAAPHRSPDAEPGPVEGHGPLDAEHGPAEGHGPLAAEHGSAEGRRSPDAESEVAGGHRSSDEGPEFAGGHRLPAAEADDRPTSGAAADAPPGAGGRAADDDFDGRFVDQAASRPTSAADAHAAGRHDVDAALAEDPAAGQPSADRAGHRWEPAFEGVPTDTRSAEADQPRHRPERSSADPFPSTPPDDPSGLPDDLPNAAEVAEPDEDDPADEPPPQSVRPSDAVRVARMGAEVLVVDGRPRYHLGGCPHLAGRQSEPLPVNEAVELGFSPCGRCRPVDHLVARATHR